MEVGVLINIEMMTLEARTERIYISHQLNIGLHLQIECIRRCFLNFLGISQEDKGTILLSNLAWLKAKPDFMVEINFG